MRKELVLGNLLDNACKAAPFLLTARRTGGSRPASGFQLFCNHSSSRNVRPKAAADWW